MDIASNHRSESASVPSSSDQPHAQAEGVAEPTAIARRLGFVSLGGFLITLVMSVIGDPMALTLPFSLLAIASGAFSVRRHPEGACGQVGLHGAIVLLFFWVIFQVLGQIIGYDFYTMPVIWRP